jgi:ABC-type multidrug transport system ATPase subunit
VLREGVAYLPELMTLPLGWRADEAIARLATLAGVPAPLRAAACERVIEAVGIGEHRGKKLKALSKGNLQRLGLALTLLADRRVMVFDEPTHGLDPVWSARFRDIVASLRRADRAILIASHNLDELERLCDRVAIIDRGRIQRVVSVRATLGAAAGEVRRWRVRTLTGVDALAAAFPGASVAGDGIEFAADLPALNRALASAIGQGTVIISVAPAESSLEEAFRTAVSR